MKEYSAEGNYYTINHVVMFTGLSDRTIRNYINLGFLKGEKINGLWHFTPEQVNEFLVHPSVRPSILAKNNSLVYDFLLDNKKTEHESCIILDIPTDNAKDTSEFFCYEISNGDYKNIRFSFDCVKGNTPRVILKGNTKDVMGLVNKYYNRESLS